MERGVGENGLVCTREQADLLPHVSLGQSRDRAARLCHRRSGKEGTSAITASRRSLRAVRAVRNLRRNRTVGPTAVSSASVASGARVSYRRRR
jgi:hypothetical protein